jgi:uncharacterized membrane protein YdjX (TVP38/TMEM64 family)
VKSGPPGGGTWTAVAVTVAGIAAILVLVVAVPTLREALGDAVRGDTDQVKEDLSEGIDGILLVLALAMVHTVVWYPAEILDTAAGFVFGFWAALALVMAGWIASGIAAYYVGRHAARPLLYRFAGEERFRRLERAMERGGVTFLLACRLIPIVPFSLTGYVAGAARVPIVRYTWTTAVGYVPITAYFIYLGSRLEEFSFADPIVWIGAAGLLGALLFVRMLLPRSYAEKGGDSG